MTISLFSILLLAPYPTRVEGSCSVSLRKRPFGPSGWGGHIHKVGSPIDVFAAFPD